MNDDKQGIYFIYDYQLHLYCDYILAEHDPLFYLVYEHTPVVRGSLEPHFWGYRPHITLEHLTRYMQRQKKQFPILKEFVKNVSLGWLVG